MHSGIAPHGDWPITDEALLDEAANDESTSNEVPPGTVLMEALGDYGSTLTEATPENVAISEAISALKELLLEQAMDHKMCPYVDPTIDFMNWACQLPLGHRGGHSCS